MKSSRISFLSLFFLTSLNSEKNIEEKKSSSSSSMCKTLTDFIFPHEFFISFFFSSLYSSSLLFEIYSHALYVDLSVCLSLSMCVCIE